MRIGIYGGTFDPVHLGHLVLAEQCREQCALDEVWFVPAGHPPHKSNVPISPAAQRAEMLELALAGHERFRIQRLELNRPGPSFTVDTLQQLRNLSPDHEFFLLMGADSLHDFPTWREPLRILQIANLVAVNRGGESGCDLSEFSQQFGAEAMKKILTVQMPGLEISSRDLRQRLQNGKSIRYLVPRGVEMYITQHTLYRGCQP